MAERTHINTRQMARQVAKAQRAGRPAKSAPEHWRPQTRGDCLNMPRPCPFYGCRHHLGLDVTYAGSIRMPFGNDLDAMKETCSLDVADRGGHNYDAVGRLTNYNKERVRQVLTQASDALRAALGTDTDK